MTSLLSQRRQFGLNCKKIIALKIAYKIVAFFAENYPSIQVALSDINRFDFMFIIKLGGLLRKLERFA